MATAVRTVSGAAVIMVILVAALSSGLAVAQPAQWTAPLVPDFGWRLGLWSGDQRLGPLGVAQIGPIVPPERPQQFPGPIVRPQLVETTALMRAALARSTHGVTGAGLTVAVLDTGLRTTHNDFAGRVLTQRNFTTDNGGDANNAADGHGHGTNVAGIVCANSVHTGIAPGANVIPLKVLPNVGGGQWTWLADALQWVIDNRTTYNITVCNLSLGSGENWVDVPSESFGIRTRIQTLRNSRVAVVIAAGNDFHPHGSAQGMAFPGICPEGVSVGAVYDANIGGVGYGSGAIAYTTGPDRITPFSQRLHQATHPTNRTDIFAPGAELTSSGIASDTGSSIMHGTSQAAPAAAGLILLMQQRYHSIHGQLPTVDQIEGWLRTSGVSINDGDDENDNVTNTGLNFLRADALDAVALSVPAPTVTSIAPNSGVNDGAVGVTITGTGFRAGATATLRRSGQPDITGTGLTVVSLTQITCTFDLTGAAAGAWNVVVTNDDAQSGQLNNGFTVRHPAPTVTAIDPDFAKNDGPVNATITGTNFRAGATAKLTRSGQPDIHGTGVTVVSPTQITCAFNLNGVQVGDWNVVVTNDDAQSGQLDDGFEVGHAAPTVVSIVPAAGANNGPVDVTITGTRFRAGATAKLTRAGQPDIPGTDLTLVSATQITCTFNLNGAALGLWNVVVTNEDDQSGQLDDGFDVQHPAPAVLAIAPNSGTNDGTVNVTITGANFRAGATAKLTRAGQPDIPGTGLVLVSATQITCTLNINGAQVGTWNVAVTNDDAKVGMLYDGFTVLHPAPTITDIDPDAGTNEGPVTVTITGTGFRVGAVVRLTRAGQPDIVATGLTVLSGTVISCTLNLSGAQPGLWNVVVTNDDTQSATLVDGFTVLPPHMVTITDGPQGNPNPVASGGNVACTVTAEDTHGHGLTYHWTATGGTFNDATAQNPTWTAPANLSGVTVGYTITVTVTCVHGTVHDIGSYVQQVETLVHAVQIIAGPQGNPNPVASGAGVACTVTARDTHEHDVHYQWTATGGVFNDPTRADPTWTAPENRTNAPVDYLVTVTVTCADDPSLTATAAYTQRVSPVPHEVAITVGPRGNPDPVASGEEVQCLVIAEDSREGHAVNYAWTATGGSFDDPSAQNPTWTAPHNLTAADVAYEISVTASCAHDASVRATTSYAQQVTPLPHTVTIAQRPEGHPHPVPSRGQAVCTVNARDSHGHALNYAWLATGGSFDDPTSPTPTWTAPANTSDANAEYTISVTVTSAADASVRAFDSYQQLVTPAPHAVAITAGPAGDPNPVASGGDVLCTVTAEDTRGHNLVYEWSADGGTFDDPAAPTPTWTAPANTTDEAATYGILVVIRCAEDPAIADAAAFTVSVEPVAHTLTITAGPQGDPNPVASGGEVACSVTAQDSRDGHDMRYEWTATAGSFDDPSAQNPTWTAPDNPADVNARHTITVTVSCAADPGVTATASYTQEVEPAAHTVTIHAGPQGDPNPVASGGDVACEVTVRDSRGHDLQYRWTATGGTFDDFTASNPTWTAPANRTDAAVLHTITVTATCTRDDALSATASYTQRVEPVAHAVTITAGPEGDPNPAGLGATVACSVTAEDSRQGHGLVYAWSATGGTFSDATAQNPTWTAPSLPGAYDISVTVTCAEDGSVSASGSYVQEVRAQRLFPAGLSMLSVPVIPTNPDPRQIGFDGNRWARWDPALGEYLVYPDSRTWFDPADSVPGKGYWTRFVAPTNVGVAGMPAPAGAYAVQVPAGWVQIGNPRVTDVPWRLAGAGALRVRWGGGEKTLAEAQAAGWCDDFAWGYRPGVGYELVYDSTAARVLGPDSLAPWQGYWFRAHRAVELLFPAVTTAAAAAARPPAERAEGEWSIPLLAALEDGSAAQAVVGQATRARRMDLPPGFGGGVELSVLAGGARLGVDLREVGEAPVWTLEAVTTAPDAKVTLRWPDLAAVPPDCRPVLVDLATGKRTYMRTSPGYTYTADAAGTRRFEVRLAPSGADALALTGVAAATAGGGSVELRVTLSSAATLDAEVLNIAGRQVGTVCRGREMDAGAAVVLWNAQSDLGTRVPGGRYLIRVTARTEDGQQSSVIAPLQLGR